MYLHRISTLQTNQSTAEIVNLTDIPENGITFGRGERSDVKLLSNRPEVQNGMSRIHAKIFYDRKHEEYSILDSNSVNGILLNWTRIPKNIKIPLKLKDIVCFGGAAAVRYGEFCKLDSCEFTYIVCNALSENHTEIPLSNPTAGYEKSFSLHDSYNSLETEPFAKSCSASAYEGETNRTNCQNTKSLIKCPEQGSNRETLARILESCVVFGETCTAELKSNRKQIEELNLSVRTLEAENICMRRKLRTLESAKLTLLKRSRSMAEKNLQLVRCSETTEKNLLHSNKMIKGLKQKCRHLENELKEADCGVTSKTDNKFKGKNSEVTLLRNSSLLGYKRPRVKEIFTKALELLEKLGAKAFHPEVSLTEKLSLNTTKIQSLDSRVKKIIDARKKQWKELNAIQAKRALFARFKKDYRCSLDFIKATGSTFTIMEENLSCPICLNMYETAVMFSCSHSLCLNCWNAEKGRQKKNHKRSPHSKGKIKYECPSCRGMVKEKPIRAKLIDELVKNLKHQKARSSAYGDKCLVASEVDYLFEEEYIRSIDFDDSKNLTNRKRSIESAGTSCSIDHISEHTDSKRISKRKYEMKGVQSDSSLQSIRNKARKTEVGRCVKRENRNLVTGYANSSWSKGQRSPEFYSRSHIRITLLAGRGRNFGSELCLRKVGGGSVLVVKSIGANTVAAKYGVRKNDWIVEVSDAKDGLPVVGDRMLRKILDTDAAVQLTIWRRQDNSIIMNPAEEQAYDVVPLTILNKTPQRDIECIDLT